MATLKAAKAAVNKFKSLLAPGWHVETRIVSLPPDRLAECTSDTYSRVAIIRVRPDVPDDEVEITVLHELAHITLADYEVLVANIITECVAPQAQKLMARVVEDQEERICELLAQAFTAITTPKPGPKKRKEQPEPKRIGFRQ